MEIAELYKIFTTHNRVCTDTRKLEKGDLFFALKGENFDGNVYAPKALELGASFAIVDHPDLKGRERMIWVEDVLRTLQDLANFHRRTFEVPLIAITGSNGKTTTKELLSQVLAMRYKTHFTQGNFNNHIGLPLTLLAMPTDTEVAVIEMGANHQGEIDQLCSIAEPTHGLITNIGKAHLEGFGGIEGVKKGKSELYRYLAKNKGMAFINKDEPFLEELADAVETKLFYLQVEELRNIETFYEVQLIEDRPFVKAGFLSEEQEIVTVNSNLVGLYNFKNIATAITLGKYFKVPALDIKKAIESYIPSNNRSQWLKKGTNTFLLDAYNANPSSMGGALDYFSSIPTKTKVVILGDMLELGEDHIVLHQEIIDKARMANFSQCVFVGKIFSELAASNKLIHFQNVENLKSWFEQQQFENTHFLVKGSRGIKLEKLLD